MSTVIVAFEILPESAPKPEGYSRSRGNLIFDVKMNFTRKARLFKNGHNTPDSALSTFASVVSRDRVRIAFTNVALNGLDVNAANIQNAYLQAPVSENILRYADLSLELVVLNKRALYGGKSSRSDFWCRLRTCITFLNFESCQGDPEVWRQKAAKDNGKKYWKYNMLLYVDYALCCSNKAEVIARNQLCKYFELQHYFQLIIALN